MKNKKNSKGQSLFELVVALMVIGLTLVAIVGLVGSSVSNNTFSRQRTEAAKYTQQAIEWLRSERDKSWGDFTDLGSVDGTTYCMPDLSLSEGACGDTQTVGSTKYRRYAEFYYDDTDEDRIEVRVVTYWEDADGVHESRISTIMTNWRTK